MVLHLTSAAISNTPPDGKVTVSISLTAENEISLVVDDNGTGISKTDLHAFNNRTSVGEDLQDSLWQSLTIVQSLADLHLARFDLFSRLGYGTCGSIVFPSARTVET